MRPELFVVQDEPIRVGRLGLYQDDFIWHIEGTLTYPNCGAADKIYLFFHTRKGVAHCLSKNLSDADQTTRRTHIETFRQFYHLLRVLTFTNSDTFFQLFGSGLHVFPDCN